MALAANPLGRGQRASLAPPPDDPRALAGFPTRRLGPGQTLFRVIRQGRGPWWFGSSLAGRFDLPEPDGTCYLATDPLAALLEMIGADRIAGAIAAELFAARRLRQLVLPHPMSLADLTSRKAAGFGVTAEIDTLVPYALPQAWAARLRAAGHDGVLYWLRHDPSRSRGIALFGPHGERASWRKGRELPISDEVRERLARECGIEVLTVPRAGDLTIRDGPKDDSWG